MRKERKIEISDIIAVSAAVAVLACGLFVFKPVIVKGESMEPTYYENDYLIVNKLKDPEHIKTGDIVVIKKEGLNELLIKRVIGTPGEVIVIRDGEVSVNWQSIKEPYIDEANNDHKTNGIWTVPENSLFVMGDNRLHSFDSRDKELGFISYDEIVGKVSTRPFHLKKFY